MNLLERVLTLLRVNLNSMMEKADDPEKVLRQLQIDMRNQLLQVKTQVATAISESRKLRSRIKEKKAEADVWYRKAELAIQQNNDAAARNGLIRYNEITKQIERYQQQQQEQDQLVSTMKGILQQLEAKISEVETSIELLATRKRNALLQQRVYDALQKSEEMKKSGQAERVYDNLMDAEARANAMADLHHRNLDAQLEQLTQEQLFEQQLNAMKTRQNSKGQTPLLQEGNTYKSPLIPPQPEKNPPVRKHTEIKQTEKEPSDMQSDSKELDITQLKKLMEQ
jgi:phage shock protein A